MTAEVVEGIIDPNVLYMARATPKEVMDQIKKDLNESMKYFGDNNSFDPYGRGNLKGYWSKAATECLMGEVYLWISKVTTDDDIANETNLTIAKTHLQNVINNYGLKLMDDFSSVFDAKMVKAMKKSFLLSDMPKVKRKTIISYSLMQWRQAAQKIITYLMEINSSTL